MFPNSMRYWPEGKGSASIFDFLPLLEDDSASMDDRIFPRATCCNLRVTIRKITNLVDGIGESAAAN